MDGDLKQMNIYMNRVALETISYFDSGSAPSEREPERFYHGFVLGLLVDLREKYIVTSNRESGYGRYDIMLEPRNREDAAIIIEFKVYTRMMRKCCRIRCRQRLIKFWKRNMRKRLSVREFRKRRFAAMDLHSVEKRF